MQTARAGAACVRVCVCARGGGGGGSFGTGRDGTLKTRLKACADPGDPTFHEAACCE